MIDWMIDRNERQNPLPRRKNKNFVGLIKFAISIAIILLFGSIIYLKNEVAQSPSIIKPPSEPETAQELLQLARPLRLTHGASVASEKLKGFGRKLFFDAGFSANQQVSCATCHNPQKGFTDQLTASKGIAQTSMNAPSLKNVYGMHWFFHNGRADSLAMQALGPVENPLEHGATRLHVFQRLNDLYLRDYVANFGPWPAPKIADIKPASSQPSQMADTDIHIADPVAAFGLSTLGSKSLLTTIVTKAQQQVRQPIAVLQDLTAISLKPTDTAFNQLSPQHQELVNHVFANFGQAIAAFESTIRTDDTPFDLFVDRLEKASSLEAALDASFTEKELKGLKIFVSRGQCTFCHRGPLLTDQEFHNIGLPSSSHSTVDFGRAIGILQVKNSPFNCLGPYLKQEGPNQTPACAELPYIDEAESDLVGAFKTPSLRGLKDTFPYGHDGRFEDLNAVLKFYATSKDPPAIGHRSILATVRSISEQDIPFIVAFLNSLNSTTRWHQDQ
jgi:cytochrome c peroxidase